MYARVCLGEKRWKRVVISADGQVTQHRTIKLETVFETVELSAGIARLIPVWPKWIDRISRMNVFTVKSYGDRKQ